MRKSIFYREESEERRDERGVGENGRDGSRELEDKDLTKRYNELYLVDTTYDITADG